jgi:serine/threonine protein kinase
MLISDFVSNRSVSRELETLLKEHRDLDAFVNALWKDLLKVLLFLREQDHLHVDLRPVNVLFDEERGQWVVTSFTHEQYGRGPVSEVEAVRQAGVLLEDIVRAARSAGRPVSPDLPEIVERIDRGRIATLESLDLAMRRLFSRIARDDAPFEKAA